MTPCIGFQSRHKLLHCSEVVRYSLNGQLSLTLTLVKSAIGQISALGVCHVHVVKLDSCNSFIDSGYFSSASSSPLLLRGAPGYSIDSVSEQTRRCATGNCE